jgi:hypothetical protein
MRQSRFLAALLVGLIWSAAAYAASGVIYVDTGGSSTNSGTTDSNTGTVGSGSATITCSATTFTGSTPGCSFSGSPDLSGVVTDGSQAVYLGCESNSNAKIAWINGIDNTNKLLGTTITVTGCSSSTAAWEVGGRLLWTPANVQGQLRGGDTVQFNNNPASRTTNFFALQVDGSQSNKIIIQGKPGTRPLLRMTSGANAIINGSSKQNYLIQNLEIQHAGTGTGFDTMGAGTIIVNVKFSQGGATYVSTGSSGYMTILNSEITGDTATPVISCNCTGMLFSGNYLHDNTTGTGSELSLNTSTAGVYTVRGNVIANNAGIGLNVAGAPTTSGNLTSIFGNTFYANATSANLLVASAQTNIELYNNIFQTSGSIPNVSWTAGTAEATGTHGYNDFYTTGSANLSGLTANSTEITTDPKLNAPGSNDFTLGTGSPAKLLAFPGQGNLLGISGTAYGDSGSQQSPNTSTGGGGIIGG